MLIWTAFPFLSLTLRGCIFDGLPYGVLHREAGRFLPVWCNR